MRTTVTHLGLLHGLFDRNFILQYAFLAFGRGAALVRGCSCSRGLLLIGALHLAACAREEAESLLFGLVGAGGVGEELLEFVDEVGERSEEL